MPPFASFVDQIKGLNVLRPSGVVGDKEKKGKEERGERRKRKSGKEPCSFGVLPRVSKRKPLEFFHFKLISLRFLSIKPYLYVLGCQVYGFPNLFYEKG